MKVAIIGSGISGSYLGYLLSNKHDVTIFEADDRPGGHTNTITIETDQNRQVDTGFIVFNKKTYPNFLKLLNELDVAYQPAPMSFSLRNESTGLEYRGGDLPGLFARKRNLFSLEFWMLLKDILRIRNKALKESDKNLTVGQFLTQQKFSKSFCQNYFIPMGSAIWSCSQHQFSDFPMRFIAKFFENHGLFNLTDRPQWYVIKGGSKQYLNRLLEEFQGKLLLSTPIIHVHRTNSKVKLTSTENRTWDFDHVVFACHSDQSLKILGDQATDLEKETLSGLPYAKNKTTLHTDTSILPIRRQAWASWNYLQENIDRNVANVTYQMNILQSLNCQTSYNVTLNNDAKIAPEKIIKQFCYAHPTFDIQQEKYQSWHRKLIGVNRTSFCGAYWGAGFHEDGVKSAIAVAEVLNQDPQPSSKETSACL